MPPPSANPTTPTSGEEPPRGDAVHPHRLDQDRLVERQQGAGAVAGALDRHPQALVAREPHRGRDVGCALGVDDRHRVLIGEQVPGGSGFVPAVLGRSVDGGVDGRAEWG
jgi:hypothetical protein